MRLHVGLTTLTGSIERYAERFDMLELRAEPGRLPSPKALRRIRGQAPALTLSLMFPPKVVAEALNSPAALDGFISSADSVGAAWMVLQTGPEVGPSQRSRSKLEALSKYLARDGRRIGWEPHGMWEEEAALGFALELGIHYVQDLAIATGAQEELVYTRLRTPGPGAALRASALEKLAEELAETEEAFVVVEGRPTQRTRARVRRALAEAAALEGALDDAEGDEGEEDGESDEGEEDADDEEFADDEDAEEED
ncbi:MAG: hypothetical protein QM756_43600 [Polyangiaceae bacterium]